MDFYQIKESSTKKGTLEIYPDFKVGRSKDLMVRGKGFYAIWDEEAGLWSTDEYDVQRLVDAKLKAYAEKARGKTEDVVKLKTMGDFSHNIWSQFKKYMALISDNSKQLDSKLVYANTEVKKSDYVSRRLPYPLEAGSYDAFEEIIGTLYDPEERAKIEWAIGAIIAGDAKNIQKFIVLYGEAGAGKSTILNIIQSLFPGYYTTFEAKALTSNNNAFSTEVFRGNPLVAIQHDGDLSRIEDNTKLNSIVAHEEMTMNEKYKASYMARVNCFLFMATNKPVRITDAKSGIIRRLIDVRPSGRHLPTKKYHAAMAQIDFELGAISQHCLDVYREMGKNYYNSYRPVEMMLQTDVFFNFVEDNYQLFRDQNGTSLTQAYALYKLYCDEALIEFKLAKYKFREELKSYFKKYAEDTQIDGKHIRGYYSEFLTDKFKITLEPTREIPSSLSMYLSDSILDNILKDCPAQYTNENETPLSKWENVKTTLKDLDTSKLHYVKVLLNHIVIDFDLKDDNGEKSMEKNIEAASMWPPTYAEFSKGGSGVHLHYIYDGDATMLERIFDKDIEVKVFVGNSSLRRRLSKCNNIPIAHLNSGLPLKGAKMLNFEAVKSENSLRTLLKKNLNKDIHPGTKPSIDFIHKILEDAYASDLVYDLTDMRSKVLSFANNSTNQSEYCVKLVSQMKFKSETEAIPGNSYSEDELVFFDVEVFPNLLMVNWKFRGEGKKVIRMINPTPSEIEDLMRMKLVGFNCRRYDNHILYGRYLGYDNFQIYELSQKIISGSKNAMFREAYNISYTDVFDFSMTKQSLKKFEIELGIHHQELGLPWDEPVPEDLWDLVGEYCDNDVVATEVVFESRKGDWTARQILADLSGLTVNDTTQRHAAQIIFGNDKNFKEEFVYTDLSKEFPGYEYDFGKSLYKGEDPKEGGYVHAEPGMYSNVALLDIESMHTKTAEMLNVFGKYTKNLTDIRDARLLIKHGDLDGARKMLNGRLVKYLVDETQAKDLSFALKTVINIVYGLTAARFDNPFRDDRNKDNIVAKRGALFMIDLKEAVRKEGYTVAHIKTDSIKIPDATPEIIKFVKEFGKKYGYIFDHEATFDKFCLINKAVYVARFKGGEFSGTWDATGTQFIQPYTFKTLFSKEKIVFDDMCETKEVKKGVLYLDMNERLSDDEHSYQFIGKIGRFCPMKPGTGGGVLLRVDNDKYYAATGTKGHRWLEAELVKSEKKESDIDLDYYNDKVAEAISDISKFGDFDWFVADDGTLAHSSEPYLPWLPWESFKWDGEEKECTSCSKFWSGDCDNCAQIHI